MAGEQYDNLDGYVVRGAAPDSCWMPAECGHRVERPFSEEELKVWARRCGDLRVTYGRELKRARPPFLVAMEAL